RPVRRALRPQPRRDARPGARGDARPLRRLAGAPAAADPRGQRAGRARPRRRGRRRPSGRRLLMATIETTAPASTTLAPVPQIVVRRVGGPGPRGWLGWVTTTDHKRIGLLSLATALAFMMVGGVEA